MDWRKVVLLLSAVVVVALWCVALALLCSGCRRPNAAERATAQHYFKESAR
jgi:hypothetical protein